MKIEMNLKIIFLGILFFVLKELDIYLIFLIFIILHEITHIIAGILCGMKPKILRMNGLCISIEFYNYKSKNSFKKIITYLAGPIFNFLVTIFFNFVPIEYSLKMKIIYSNFLLAIFNMLPINPLDGGKIMKEILVNLIGNKEATIFMNRLTQIILIILTLSYSILILKIKNISIFLLIIYLWYLKYLEDKKMKIFLKAYETIEKNS